MAKVSKSESVDQVFASLFSNRKVERADEKA